MSEGGTLGDFLKELREKSDLKPKTLEGYAVALRKIVADITGRGPSPRWRSKQTCGVATKLLKVSSWRN